MNVKTLAIVGTIAGLGLLGLTTQSAKAQGLSLRVSLPLPTFLVPPQVIVQQPVQQQVIYQQAPQVIYQQAPQVIYQAQPQLIYQQAPQVVYQSCPAPVTYYQTQPVFIPAPVIIRPDQRFGRDDFRRQPARLDVRFGDRR